MKHLLSILFDAGRGMADERGYRLALMAGLWRSTVGDAIASNTEVVDWNGQTIDVLCSGPRWKSQLESLRAEILEKLGQLGAHAPTEVRFRLAAGDRDDARPRPRRPRRARPQRPPPRGPASRHVSPPRPGKARKGSAG